jgi:hypothetical protein
LGRTNKNRWEGSIFEARNVESWWRRYIADLVDVLLARIE